MLSFPLIAKEMSHREPLLGPAVNLDKNFLNVAFVPLCLRGYDVR